LLLQGLIDHQIHYLLMSRMVFDEFKPGNWNSGAQFCGLAMPHLIPSSGMHSENELQKSMEEMHASLAPEDSFTYHQPAAGKRSGPQQSINFSETEVLDNTLQCWINEFPHIDLTAVTNRALCDRNHRMPDSI